MSISKFNSFQFPCLHPTPLQISYGQIIWNSDLWQELNFVMCYEAYEQMARH